MALRERLIRETNQTGAGFAAADEAANSQHSFQEMKSRLHRALINRMDLTKLGAMAPEQANIEVLRLAEGVLAAEAMPLSTAERERRSEEHTSELQSQSN